MGEPPGITREAIFRVFADTTGLTPADAHQVLTLFALQVTLEVWRNSPLEDAHHEGFIGDEDMLRANSFTNWQVREISRRWRDDYEISDLADVRFDEFEDLLTRLKEMLLDTGRLLPHALIVEDVLGDHVEEMLDHMEDQLDVYAFLANHRVLMLRSAAQRSLARCSAGTGGRAPDGLRRWSPSMRTLRIQTMNGGRSLRSPRRGNAWCRGTTWLTFSRR